VEAVSKLPTKIFFILLPFVFQLCGLDEAYPDPARLCGTLKRLLHCNSFCVGSGVLVLRPVIVGNGPNDELRPLLDLFKYAPKILGDDTETEQLNGSE